MANDFGKIKIEQKTGDERLTFNDRETGFKLIDFWQWSVSDLVSNATRGRFAEFITLKSLQNLTSPIAYDQLRQAIVETHERPENR